MSLSTRLKSGIAIGGGLAGIVTLLMSLMAALPCGYSVPVDGVHCELDTFIISRLDTSTGTRIDGCHTGREEVSWSLGFFGGSSILTASGEVLDESVAHIWVVLIDRYGQAYVQYPAARIAGSRWSMENICVGREIARIEFWNLAESGHASLQEMADEMAEYHSCPSRPIEDLPTHAVLGSVDLVYKAGFLFSIF